ncbi:MAG: amidohydrolase family protein [Chlamydiia bacterium]|nr:amidohydrolase family protein [Chlamydiia bacterium]
MHALSADHLEQSTEEEWHAFQQSGTIPIVLPGSSLGLGLPFAPARQILDAGLPLVIASDWNPGSAPMGNLLTQAALIGAAEKLSLGETLAAITSRAAAALQLTDRGILEPGKRADFNIFLTNNWQEIFYAQGRLMPSQVFIGGECVLST